MWLESVRFTRASSFMDARTQLNISSAISIRIVQTWWLWRLMGWILGVGYGGWDVPKYRLAQTESWLPLRRLLMNSSLVLATDPIPLRSFSRICLLNSSSNYWYYAISIPDMYSKKYLYSIICIYQIDVSIFRACNPLDLVTIFGGIFW